MGSALVGQWRGLVSISILVSEGSGESSMDLEEPTSVSWLLPCVWPECQAPPHYTWVFPPPRKETTAGSIQELGLWQSLSQEQQADKDVFHSGGVN